MESMTTEKIIIIDDKATVDLFVLSSENFNQWKIQELCYQKHLNSSDFDFDTNKILMARNSLKVHHFAPKIKNYINSGKISAKSENLHPLFVAVYYAYTYHIPLILSPDHIWLTIIQGLSHHIKANSENLRSKFVCFEGKMDIILIRDDFVYGALKMIGVAQLINSMNK